MSRTRDYVTFAVRFCGCGYVALWPLSTPDSDGALFGASLLCGGRAPAMMDWLCAAPHPLRLSAPLHLAGALCTLAVIVCLLYCAVRRPAVTTAMSAAQLAARLPSLRRARRRRPRLRPVRPRGQFGLRGLSH